MTIFVTGATGKVGKSLVKRLHEANAPALSATRSGTVEPPSKAVRFDWFDEKTYAAPFETDPNFDRIFLIQPAIFDPPPPLWYFVNGKVHENLADRGVDYVILGPTSFTENFGMVYYHSIREKDEIFSACGNGKVAYVSVDDITQAARDALPPEKTTNNHVFIVGPQLYSHDEIAALLSDVPGRKIKHRKLTSEKFQKALQNFGMEEKYAKMLVYIHEQIASGNEAAVTKTPNAYIGKYNLPEYFKAHKNT